MVRAAGVNSKTLGTVKYPNIPSGIKHIPHSNKLPVPIFKSFEDLSNEVSRESSTEQDNDECEAGRIEVSNKPNLFGQHAVDNLIRDLGLPKLSAKLLASRLKKRNLLTADTKVSYYQDRKKSFLKVFLLRRQFRILP